MSKRVLTLGLASFTVVLLTASLPIPLPAIADEFHTGQGKATLVFITLIAAFVVGLSPAGRLIHIVGARRALIAGLFISAGASVLAATAPTMGALFGSQLGLGLGAAIVEYAAFCMSGDEGGDQADDDAGAPHDVALLAAGALGPILSGAATTVFGWRSLFVVVAILALGSAGPAVTLRDSGIGQPSRLAHLLRRRKVRLGLALRLITEFASLGVFVALSGYLQSELSYSALETGLLLTSIVLGAVVIAPIAEGPLSDVEPRLTGIAGFGLIAAGGFWIAQIPPAPDWPAYALALLVSGCGFGLIEPLVDRVLKGATPPTGAVTAWRLSYTSYLLGILLGVVTVEAVRRVRLATGGPPAAAVGMALAVCATLALAGVLLASMLPTQHDAINGE